jgi:hypothetical protein
VTHIILPVVFTPKNVAGLRPASPYL